ncbi:Adenosylhomocysteinase [Lunatimonas lonarensis]|uniref:Adenosylhomocysteinase n=1 Tax=Lunatimonas lonarensis TaxID=1232681 RepID=R7ZQG2_9BACT|nr:NUDIX hydrolase [Lunatimonas lonarensis]EON76322.1 Adenosylhomocysteinase [Lunatimonas lonarensis]
MNRSQLRYLLEHYRTVFEEEQQFVAEFLDLVEDPLAFHRERTAGHFTASSWIVNKTRTHTLLTLHKKLNKWLQLGGHADGNDNLLEVCLNEAREESGLTSLRLVDRTIFDIDRHLIPSKGEVEEHYHYDVRFLIEAEMDESLTMSDESTELAWISFDMVEAVVNGNVSILRMLEKTSRSEIFS